MCAQICITTPGQASISPKSLLSFERTPSYKSRWHTGSTSRGSITPKHAIRSGARWNIHVHSQRNEEHQWARHFSLHLTCLYPSAAQASTRRMSDLTNSWQWGCERNTCHNPYFQMASGWMRTNEHHVVLLCAILRHLQAARMIWRRKS